MTRFKPGTVALWVVSAAVFVYLFIPLVTIAIFTFNEPTTKFNTTWEGFTLDNWRHPFSEKLFTDALIQSVRVAGVACVLATILGSLIAMALGRYRMRGSGAINLLLILPLTTPEIVMGASLFTLFFNYGAERGFTTIVIAHTLFCLSFVAMTVKARTRGMDWSLEDAAMDLGSPPLRTFWKITFPGILPGVVGRLHAVAGPVDRRLHHHVVRGRADGDVPPAGVRLGAHRAAAAGARPGDDGHARRRRDHPGEQPAQQGREGLTASAHPSCRSASRGSCR